MAKITSSTAVNDLSFDLLPKFFHFFPDYLQKLFPAYLMKEIEYLFCTYKYRKMLKNPESIESILVIIDINIDENDILHQCSKVLRYYFPDTRIDFICNRGGNIEIPIPAIQYHDNIFCISYGKGFSTFEDNEITGEIVSNTNYSVILNLSPFIEKEPFKNNLNFIQLYNPFYAYLNYLSCFNRSKIRKVAALHSFLHYYFSPIMLEKEYPIQVKREYLLRIQNP